MHIRCNRNRQLFELSIPATFHRCAKRFEKRWEWIHILIVAQIHTAFRDGVYRNMAQYTQKEVVVLMLRPITSYALQIQTYNYKHPLVIDICLYL